MISNLCDTVSTVIAGEDRREFARMRQDYHDELRPRGPVEQTLIDELVAAAWQLRRVRQMENEACVGAESYGAVLADAGIQEKLERLGRDHLRIESTYHRCLKEFRTRMDSGPRELAGPKQRLRLVGLTRAA